jgi:hypothetical protein
MKKVTIRIPDKKFRFFMELIQHLGFEIPEANDIPEEHKTTVRERIKTASREDMVSWKEARKKLTVKGKAQ